jgi:hypothetical protein
METDALPPVRDSTGARHREKKKADTRPAFLERGLTAMTVAGTGLLLGAASVQPGSEPGVHAGRLGLICCLSVRDVVSI